MYNLPFRQKTESISIKIKLVCLPSCSRNERNIDFSVAYQEQIPEETDEKTRSFKLTY
jgi:hypothetical protein